MKPAQQGIYIKRGDFFRFFFRIRKRNLDGTPGEYPDLTSWGDGKAQVRLSKTDSTVVAEMTVTKSDQATYPGGVLLTLDEAVTGALTLTPGLNAAIWDFEIANQFGETDTYLEGPVEFDLDVSR